MVIKSKIKNGTHESDYLESLAINAAIKTFHKFYVKENCQSKLELCSAHQLEWEHKRLYWRFQLLIFHHSFLSFEIQLKTAAAMTFKTVDMEWITVDENFLLRDVAPVPRQGQRQLFNWRQVLGLEESRHDHLVQLWGLVAVVGTPEHRQLPNIKYRFVRKLSTPGFEPTTY